MCVGLRLRATITDESRRGECSVLVRSWNVGTVVAKQRSRIQLVETNSRDGQSSVYEQSRGGPCRCYIDK